MWTHSPSARPTQRHGSWCCRSAPFPSARGDRFGRCTRSRPPRSRRCSSRRNGSPTPPCRSCWLSGWRELARGASPAPHRGRGRAAQGGVGAGRHRSLRPASAQGGAAERAHPGGVGGAGRARKTAAGGGRGGVAAGRVDATANRSPVRLRRLRGSADQRRAGQRAAALQRLRVSAPGERALPREGGVDVVRWTGVPRGVRGNHLPSRGAAVRRSGYRARARAGGPAEAGFRAPRREGRASVRCHGHHRLALGAAGHARLAVGGGVPDRDRRAPGRGSCSVERDEPHSREFLRNPMRHFAMSLAALPVPRPKRGLGNALCVSTVSRRAHPLGWVGSALLALMLAACGGAQGPHAGAVAPVVRDSGAARTVDSLGAAIARVAQDSAADQQVLDSLHRTAPRPDSVRARRDSTAAPAVKGEEVEREAVRLFGAEGKAAIGAAPSPEPTFDIDVSSFATDRRVLEYLEFFQVDSRDRFEIWLARLGRYEGMIRDRLRAKRLPEDMVYLTLIESGLSNTAVSRAKAVGMWQFIAGTARLYGLTVDPWVDERRDPFKATEAAVNYLADLRERLGSVYLAAAAYNAGVGRIERGIDRLPGEPDSLTDHTFFQLADRRYLRRETRDYVPKLIAAALIAKQPERYGFTDVQKLPPLLFDEVTIPDATGLDVIARLADTTVAAILELNPQFVRGITPPGREVTVRVPRSSGVVVAQRYDTLPPTGRITFVDHYVALGQTLSEIARRYRVTVAMIQSANPRLSARALRPGQRIIIPMSGRIVPPAAWSIPPEPRYRRVVRGTAAAGTVRVRAGDNAS